MATTSDRLDMALDEIAPPRGAGGRAPRARGGRAPRAPVTEDKGAPINPYSNEAGRTHMKGATLQEIAAAPAGQRVLKIGADTTAKKLGGSISYVTREGPPPSLLPLGATCVNQAVKGVAISRKYLAEDNIDLTMKPAFRTKARDSLVLHLAAVERVAAVAPANEVALTVAASTLSHILAGAIAAKVREQLPVCVKCVGAVAVNKAVWAIANARGYLRPDGLDICALPELVEEVTGGASSDGQLKTVVKLTIALSPLEEEVELEEGDAPVRTATGRRGGGRPPRAAPVEGAPPPVRRGGGRPPRGDPSSRLQVTLNV